MTMFRPFSTICQMDYMEGMNKKHICVFFQSLIMVFMASEAARCAQHTDNMVELRYSLWRVPMALHAMVTAVEEEKVNKVEQGHLAMWAHSDMCEAL